MSPAKQFALVTGASSGLGLEFSRQLAARGYNLIMVSRGKEQLKAAAQEITAAWGVKVHVIPLDLSQADAAQKLVNSCKKLKLTIDILVNNAGRGMVGPVTALDTDDINRLITLNCQSLFTLSSLIGQLMAERGTGHILNVGSMVGLQPVPYFAPYAASKSFVTSLSIAMHGELKSRGVVVTCLVPGFMRTGFETSAGITNETYLKISAKSAMDPARTAAIGLKGLFGGKSLVVAGLSNKAGAFFSSLFPARLTAWLLEKSLKGLV